MVKKAIEHHARLTIAMVEKKRLVSVNDFPEIDDPELFR